MKYWLDRILWYLIELLKSVVLRSTKRIFRLWINISRDSKTSTTVKCLPKSQGARAQHGYCLHYCLKALGGEFQVSGLPCQLDWPASQQNFKIWTYYPLEILEIILCALYLLFMYCIHRDKLSKWQNIISFPWKMSTFGEMKIRCPLNCHYCFVLRILFLQNHLLKMKCWGNFFFSMQG